MLLQANKQNHEDKELVRRRHQKEEKIQDISEEKRAPKTTKQTVSLTTVAGQKAQEKSLNGTYTDTAYKKKHYKEQIIIMKIFVYRLTFQESPLHLQYYQDNHEGYTTETTTS